MSDQQQPGRKVEHFEVRVPSPLEVADMRDYPAAVMRAVALAANEAGLAGKRLDGFAMIENSITPRIVLQVSKRKPGWIDAGFSPDGIEFDASKAEADTPRMTLDWATVLEMHAKYAPLSSEPATGDNTSA